MQAGLCLVAHNTVLYIKVFLASNRVFGRSLIFVAVYVRFVSNDHSD